LFTLGIVIEIAEVSRILGYFFQLSRLCIIFDKNVFGYILGIFHKLIWSQIDANKFGTMA
jgi:hypothetical protein